MSDPVVRTYVLADAARGSFAHPILGEVVFDFPAGEVRPRSEAEELVLEVQLVPNGLATVAGEDDPQPLNRFVALQAPTPDDELVEDQGDADTPPAASTKAALIAEAEALGLDTAGTKAELADRIEAARTATTTEEPSA